MKRPFFAPEHLQISSMDCGVAALTSLLAGSGVAVDYERLRHACRTDVDGTSIDALEAIASDLGLDVCQHLVPPDLLVDAVEERYPAIAIVDHAGGAPHFVTLWRRIGSRIHVMDPGRGRGWTKAGMLEEELHTVRFVVPTARWLGWFRSSALRASLVARGRLVLSRVRADALRRTLEETQSMEEVCAVDTSLRLVLRTARAGAARTASVRDALYDAAEKVARETPAALPDELRALEATEHGLALRAAVFLAAREAGARAHVTPPPPPPPAPAPGRRDVLRDLSEPREPPLWRHVFDLLEADGRTLLAGVAFAVLAVALGSTIEVLFVRGALDAPRMFSGFGSRLGVSTVTLLLIVVVLGFELTIQLAARKVGRLIEIRLRARTLALVADVDDAFIRSRATSDLAYRAHGLVLGRQLPELAVSILRDALDLSASAIALAFVLPATTFVTALGLSTVLGLSLAFRPALREIEGRFHAHGARMLTLYFDALRGFRPVRLHGYQPAFRADFARTLERWRITGVERARILAWIAFATTLTSMAILGAVFWIHASRSGDPRTFVVVAFWALRIPRGVSAIVGHAESYPAARQAFVRLLEIARKRTDRAETTPVRGAIANRRGVELVVDRVTVHAHAHVLLDDVSVHVPRGEHVAIVGASGSGKSSFVGMFLGFHSPDDGSISVDGATLDHDRVRALNQRTAWVDTSVQLWNESLLANLTYAVDGRVRRDFIDTLEASDLLPVLENLDRGLETAVGSEGRSISGGEGQRVRLGRALLASPENIDLVILDEAFRGLDRPARARLVRTTRTSCPGATVLCITHDIEHALDFDRVLVFDGGRIVEDDDPRRLASSGSRFRALLEAERAALRETWEPCRWRRLRIERGAITELAS